MWVKVDDGFVEHPKVARAAVHLGRGGAGRVVAVWLEAICYSARNLTDGYVPTIHAQKFITDRRPLDVLEVMALDDVRLMRKVGGGFQFHDWQDYQPLARDVKAKRAKDRERKAAGYSDENRGGFRADSERIPERSRARDPVPVPSVPSALKEQRRVRRMLPIVPLAFDAVRPHLLKAAHLALDVNVTCSDSDIAEAVKTAAAKLQVQYDGRSVTAIVNAARARRVGA